MEKKSNFAVKVIQLIFFAFAAKGFGFVREIVLAKLNPDLTYIIIEEKIENLIIKGQIR